MSTFEAKVQVVYDFLANRASLKRLTTHQEVATVAGYVLKGRHERRIDSPVRREKIKDVLKAVDEKSWSEKNVLLSATVAHFWDNDSSRAFYKRASSKGVVPGYVGRGEQTSFIDGYRNKVFSAYQGSFPVSQSPAPKPAARRFGSFEEEKRDAARRSNNRLGDRVREYEPTVNLDDDELSEGLVDFTERLDELVSDFKAFKREYTGRHRSEARV